MVAATLTGSKITTSAAASEAAMAQPRRVYTPQERAEYLALFEQSKMTLGDFCREMGLNGGTFSLWRRASREGASSAESLPQFAEVQMRPSRPRETTAVTVLLPSGAKIEVSVATDAVWQGLGLLLRSLHS